MNRKQRRAQQADGGASGLPASDVGQVFAEALRHHQAGRLDEAERLYRRVLAADPRHADSLHLLGVIAYQTGRHDAAIAAIGQAIAVKGGVAAFHCNLGLALTERGRLDEAVASFRRALALKADYPEAQSNLGLALAGQGRFGQAEAAYRAAIALRPDYAEAHSNLGVALQEQGRLDAAEAAYRAAIALRPDYAEAHSNMGEALRVRGRPDEAADSCRAALALRPDHVKALCNLGNALRDLGRPGEAEAAYRRALALVPDLAEAHANLGVALQEQGRLDEAVASCRTALALRPDYVEAHYNLGAALLQAGRFAEGWEEYGWRWRRRDPPPARRHADRPPWRGGRPDGRTVLLWAEQGLGDTIQFVRYLPALVQAGWRVVAEVQGALAPLLRTIEGVTVVAIGAPLPPFDVQCPFLDLPRIFATTLETIPACVPYLRADPEAAGRWRQRLAGHPGTRVGLAWRGNPDHKRDRHRSIAAAAFAPLLRVPGLAFVSLQKEARPDELAALAAAGPVVDAGPLLDDFAATAALVANLDLVVSVDTALCHLAGALGIPTWTLVAFAPDWRWLAEREDSPWYPTMRLFRQPASGDWSSVVESVATALGRLAQPASRAR